MSLFTNKFSYSYHQIEPGLLLGDLDASNNQELLKELKVTAIFRIIQVADEDKKDLKHFENIFYHHVSVRDQRCDAKKLYSHLPSICKKIHQEKSKPNGVVLVHCREGRSRSATVIVAFLLWRLIRNQTDSFLESGITTVKSTIQQVKKIRPQIDPSNFEDILERFRSDRIEQAKKHQECNKCVKCRVNEAHSELYVGKKRGKILCVTCFSEYELDELE